MAQLARVRTSVLDITYEHSVLPKPWRSCFCTDSPTIPEHSTKSWPSSTRLAFARSFLTCADTAQRACCHPIPYALASKQPWARTSWTCSTRSKFDELCWAVLIGAVA